MKILFTILLLITFACSHAQKPNTDDVAMVINTLESYKRGIESLDTTGTGKLFVSKSVVIESGK